MKTDDIIKHLRDFAEQDKTWQDSEDESINKAAADEIERLRKERDELLAALEHILAGSLSLPRFAEDQARSAIARVKGAE